MTLAYNALCTFDIYADIVCDACGYICNHPRALTYCDFYPDSRGKRKRLILCQLFTFSVQ